MHEQALITTSMLIMLLGLNVISELGVVVNKRKLRKVASSRSLAVSCLSKSHLSSALTRSVMPRLHLFG